jgi:hypothetical protein
MVAAGSVAAGSIVVFLAAKTWYLDGSSGGGKSAMGLVLSFLDARKIVTRDGID